MTAASQQVTILEELAAEDSVRRDRYDRYLVKPPEHPKPIGYSRATTIAKALDDENSLKRWAMRMVATGLHKDSSLMDEVVAALDDKQALNAVCERALAAGGGNDRRDLGTAIHAAFEDYTRGGPLGDHGDDVAAIHAAIANAGYDVLPEYIERMVVLDEHAIAGTADMILRRRSDDRLFIADLKTGSGVQYGGLAWAIQLAIYARADNLYTQGPAADGSLDVREPMPEVNWSEAIIIHCEPGTADAKLYTLDISAGWNALKVALDVRWYRKLGRRLLKEHENAGADDGKLGRSATSAPARIDPLTTTKQRPDEGPLVDDAKVETLKARVQADAEVLATVSEWVKQGTKGKVPWNFGNGKSISTRRYGIALVATEVAPLGDQVMRNLLTDVLGEDRVQPDFPTGAILGSLTIDEARRMWKAATS